MKIFKLNSPGNQPDLAAVDLEPLPGNLDEATSRLPGGAYTTIRTYQHCRVLHLANQLNRLDESARLAQQPVQLDRTDLSRLIRVLLHTLPADQDARLRIIVDLEQQPGVLYGLGEVLHALPESAYQKGVSVLTSRLQRANPMAKLTNFIQQAAPLRQKLPPGVNELLMVDQQANIREGLSSNFFAVREGCVWTADEGVLAGITRSLVLDEARLAGLPLCLQPVRLADLTRLQEAFITSASRGILPVRQIDGQLLGAECPGPVTRLLMARFADRLELELETID